MMQTAKKHAIREPKIFWTYPTEGFKLVVKSIKKLHTKFLLIQLSKAYSFFLYLVFCYFCQKDLDVVILQIKY